MAIIEDLLTVLDKRVKEFRDWGDYWEYTDVLDVLDCYEKHKIVVTGGLTREKLDNELLSDLDNYWCYDGQDYKESIELARRIIGKIKGHKKLLVEIDGARTD